VPQQQQHVWLVHSESLQARIDDDLSCRTHRLFLDGMYASSRLPMRDKALHILLLL
jgi:hypothetical protein